MKREWRIAAAATFVLAFALTFPGFRPGRVLLPIDHPRDQEAWKPDPGSRYEISNKIVSDPIYEYLAWDVEIRRHLRSGEMPWRSRWAGDGAHLFANPETALLFPFTWPRILFGERGWVLTVFLKLWAGALGLWWLARLLGAEWRLAFSGAAVYAMSGYMTMWLLFPHTNVYAVLPWLAGSSIRFMRNPSRTRAAAVVATAALATAGGHPETLFHGVIALAAFLLIVTRVRPPRRLALVAALALTGFLMVSVQLIPFAVALAKSDIVQTRGAQHSHHARLFAIAAQVLPGFLGSPLRGELDLSGIAQPAAENFNERNAGYAGAITLIVIAVAWRRLSRELRIGLLIGIASLVIASNIPVVRDVVRLLPLFGIAANERIPLVLVLFASAALPAAIASVSSERPKRAAGYLIAAIALTIAIGATFSAVPAGHDFLVKRARMGIARMQERDFLRKPLAYYDERLEAYLSGLRLVAVRRIALPMALIACAGIALTLSRRREPVLAAAVIAEMLLFSWGYAPAVHIRDGAGRPPVIDDVRRLDPTNEFLIAASEHVYDANLGTLHEVRDVRSYDVLQTHDRIAWLVSLGFDRVYRAFPPALPDSSISPLASAGVRFFLSRQPPNGLLRVGGEVAPAVGVYELPGAVPSRWPVNSPPPGLALGALISLAAVAAAVALVFLLPYHRF